MASITFTLLAIVFIILFVDIATDIYKGYKRKRKKNNEDDDFISFL